LEKKKKKKKKKNFYAKFFFGFSINVILSDRFNSLINYKCIEHIYSKFIYISKRFCVENFVYGIGKAI